MKLMAYNRKFINSVMDNPNEYFTYNLASGEIIPIYKDEDGIRKKRAEYTINLLNLNSYELKDARKNLIQILEVYKENFEELDEYLQYFLDDGHSFPSLIKYYMRE